MGHCYLITCENGLHAARTKRKYIKDTWLGTFDITHSCPKQSRQNTWKTKQNMNHKICNLQWLGATKNKCYHGWTSRIDSHASNVRSARVAVCSAGCATCPLGRIDISWYRFLPNKSGTQATSEQSNWSIFALKMWCSWSTGWQLLDQPPGCSEGWRTRLVFDHKSLASFNPVENEW